MSRRTTFEDVVYTDGEDGENMYLLENLMDLLKKAKQRRKTRQLSSNSGMWTFPFDYMVDISIKSACFGISLLYS